MPMRPRRPLVRLGLAIALLSPIVLLSPSSRSVLAQPAAPAPAPAQPPAAGTPPAAPAPATRAQAAAAERDPTRGAGMRAYHDAMARRRLGSAESMRVEQLAERVAEAEALVSVGRHDDAIARMTEVVEHPKFDLVAETQEGRAALYFLGHALAAAGIHESARAYLRRSIAQKGAWEQYGPYARRAVRRLVEIALETRAYQAGLSDLASVPASAPAEIRGEVAYITGKAKESAGDPEGALVAYAQVPQTSRFWSQATYLSGIVNVERGRLKEGENLFCKVADPKRQDRTTPVFADERFFAVRDLARLALGRVAHEQARFDDARYYYYLVPRDSDRLAESLYEAATTRYEKKDYEGARELLDELVALEAHHRYEDEARILDAYIDLALCRFPEADRKLVAFLRAYEPVRDGARRLGTSERGTRALLASARSGSDAGGGDAAGVSVSPEQLRAVAALVRVDPLYGEISRKRAVLEREASGLKLGSLMLTDMQRTLATTGGVRPQIEEKGDPVEKAQDARAAIDGVRRQIDDLEQARASADKIAPLRKELAELEARLGSGSAASAEAAASQAGTGADLPDLLRRDTTHATSLGRELEGVRSELGAAESALAKDALRRLDLRLSRLLRRARLGRIESVLGKKRALEVEIEAISAGYLPNDALDSLDAARYLRDNEEYWPFEGDDWPDEFVGSEGLK
jgi:tetratricopeptide (TPR) repeat protein